MKKIDYFFNGIFVLLMAGALVSCNTTGKEKALGMSGETDSACVRLPVAFVNIDSLLQRYNYSVDMNEQLLRKAENSRANLNQKASDFQAEYLEFQKKVENSAFLTRERMEQEGNRLARKQQTLQQESEKMQLELAQEQQKMNVQLRDTISASLKLYNKDKKYQLILTGEAILYGEEIYDITDDVIKFLNARYKPAPETTKK